MTQKHALVQGMNPRQEEAVLHTEGPLLVMAGAGSGKTRVLTHRIAYLIEEKEVNPWNILAITFTNKAAKEMKERVNKLLETGGEDVWVSTFHSMCVRILRRDVDQIGYNRNFTIIDPSEQKTLMKRILNDLNIDSKKYDPRSILGTISNAKNELQTPEKVAEMQGSLYEEIVAKCYEAYQKELRKNQCMDFDDLIMLPTLLFKQNEEVRSKWQEKIRYLLVDEYQDTNTSQYELIKLLVGERACFTVVGDDDQSIYSWRGARPQNMVRLRDDFPRLRVIKLEQNYRSTHRILHCANILIDNNEHVFDKKLFSNLGEGEKLQVIEAKNEEHEAERIVAELIAHRFSRKTKFKDYAILYRGNHQSRLLEKVLMQNRIPYKISGGTSFFSRAEIKDMMAYLRLVVNQDDDAAFLRIVNTPRREIGTATLQKLGELAQEKHISLFEAIFEFELMQRVTPKA